MVGPWFYLCGLGGCGQVIERELEILLAPDALANALLFRDSYLIDIFGPFMF